MKVKQVIVMRKDLNMRKGKMVAQGSHAALGAVLGMMKKFDMGIVDGIDVIVRRLLTERNSPEEIWFSEEFKKICVSVKSEEELLEIAEQAKEAGLPVTVIQDKGHTEFHNIPTYTCLAIGPALEEKIDKITSHLPLL